MSYGYKPYKFPLPKKVSTAKSITDIVNVVKYKTIKTAYLHGKPNKDAKSKVALSVGEKLEVLDFKGRFVRVRATGASGKTRVAWILIENTNINYNEFLYNRLSKNINIFDDEMTKHADELGNIALQDFKRKNPGHSARKFTDIPSDTSSHYQERKYDPFVDREAKELASKRKLSAAFLADLQKVYSFDKIFDPTKMQSDQTLPKKERKFANAKNGKVSFDVGYYPKYEKKEDVNSFLNMGEKMTATMDVSYDSEPKDKNEVDKITLNYPLTHFINNIKHRSEESKERFNNPLQQKVTKNIGLMALMVAHEYIHTAQNTMLHFKDIAKLPNIANAKDVERRKSMREILAHHHSVFPNKIYDNPKNDPVFIGTEFIRGKTAIYDKQSDWSQAFLLWMALSFIKRYEDTTPAQALSEKYKLAELKQDFNTLKEDFSKRLNINFGLKNKEAFKDHLKNLYGDIVLPEESFTPDELDAKEKAAEKKKKEKEKSAITKP